MTNTRYLIKTVAFLSLGLGALAAPGVASADGQLGAVYADIEKTVGFVPSYRAVRTGTFSSYEPF